MDFSYNEEPRRLVFAFVYALRRAIKALRVFYEETPPNPSESYELVVPNPSGNKRMKLSVECWFPYPRSCTSLITGQSTSFTFEARLHPERLLSAAIQEKSGQPGQSERILIKFTRRYGKEVHELLARNNQAPAFLGYEDLIEQNNPNKQERWIMVVMEFLSTNQDPWVMLANKQSNSSQLERYKPKIEDALKLIWAHGFVHGDVRLVNILVPEDDEEIDMRLVDFDDCGRDGIDRYPPYWNHTFRPKGAVGNGLMKKEHDQVMFEQLFNGEGS